MTSAKSPANVTTNIAAEPGSSKDALLDATPDAAAVLSEEELNKVSGGKAKTADKAYNAMMGYIKG
jgi:bacteriocin-like protein